ncbi:MAG: hypothetical protein FWC64_00485 [Treponema sp.]|nr:hypothetical protein [Treponema sp.]
MKKALLVFLLFSVLSASVFAQVSFSGSVYAGIRLQMPHDGDEAFGVYHREDNFSRVPRFDFTASVVRENYGARLDTTFQMPSDPMGQQFILNGIYGWVDFLDNQFRLTMGEISSPAWVTRLDASLDEQYFDKIRGFRIEYNTPVPGLSVGAAFRTDGHDFQTLGRRMIFGANFIHPLFNTVFAYDLSTNVRTLFGFNFTGIPDLTAGIQLSGEFLASWDDAFHPGRLQIHYKAGYRIMRPLFAYVIFGQTLHGEAGVRPYWEITPGVTYQFFPGLTGRFSVTLDNFDRSPNNNLTLNTALEHTLAGPALFYAEHKLRLDNMDRAAHTVGFGITIRAF